MFSLTNFIGECRRVLTVTRKPTNDEYKVIVKASGIGILLIGLIGFIIAVIKYFVIK